MLDTQFKSVWNKPFDMLFKRTEAEHGPSELKAELS